MSIGAVLTIIFVVLKLLGEISWSWWWVVAPTLIECGLYLLVFGGILTYQHFFMRSHFKVRRRK